MIINYIYAFMISTYIAKMLQVSYSAYLQF